MPPYSVCKNSSVMSLYLYQPVRPQTPECCDIHSLGRQKLEPGIPTSWHYKMHSDVFPSLLTSQELTGQVSYAPALQVCRLATRPYTRVCLPSTVHVHPTRLIHVLWYLSMCRVIFSVSNPFRLPSHSTFPFIIRLRQSFLSAAPGSRVSLRHNGSLMQRNLPFLISSYKLPEKLIKFHLRLTYNPLWKWIRRIDSTTGLTET